MDYLQYLSCCAGVIDGDRLYTVDEDLGVLVEYDLKDLSYCILAKIGDNTQPVIVDKLFKINNIIFLILQNTYNIWMYDLITQKLSVIGADEADLPYERELNDIAYQWKDCFYIMPGRRGHKIKVFNWKTYKFVGEIQLEDNCEKKDRVPINIGIREGKIWYTIFNTSNLIEIDIETGEKKIWVIDEKEHILAASFGEKGIWLFLSSNILVKWNPKEMITETYNMQNSAIDMEKLVFRNVFEIGEMVYIVPNFSSCMWVIDKTTRKKRDIEYPVGFKRVPPKLKRDLFVTVLINGGQLILLPYAVNMLIQVDLKSEKIVSWECKFSKRDLWEYYIQKVMMTTGIQENEVFNISDYIERLLD